MGGHYPAYHRGHIKGRGSIRDLRAIPQQHETLPQVQGTGPPKAMGGQIPWRYLRPPQSVKLCRAAGRESPPVVRKVCGGGRTREQNLPKGPEQPAARTERREKSPTVQKAGGSVVKQKSSPACHQCLFLRPFSKTSADPALEHLKLVMN